MDPFIGEIRQFAGTFAPRNWAFCEGQLLPISSNTALFSILGTLYGGDGKTTFALPDLSGRVPMGRGNGPGLTPRQTGEQVGAATVTLQQDQMPGHSHSANASVPNSGTVASPENHFWALTLGGRGTPGTPIYNNVVNTSMLPQALGVTGQGQAHNNMQPYLPLKFIIALEGIFPQRP